MNTIAVSKLRSNLIKVLKEIKHGSVIDITSRGKVVARLIPPEDSRKTAREKLKKLGKKAVLGDLISPVNADWKALKK